MGQAINDYDMILENDRVLAALSGGMDSIVLALLLSERLSRIPIQYELFPVLIDHFNGDNPEMNQKIEKLSDFILQKTRLTLKILRFPMVQNLTGEASPHKRRDICFVCAQKRRTELIKCADALGCNRIALGHHKDDIVETILMNLFYKRELSAMLPRLDLFGGKMSIIRPMAYIQKSQIEIYMAENKPFIIEEDCPAKILPRDERRKKVRKIIEELVQKVPHLKNNIFASFRNPKPDYLLDHFFDPKKSGLYKRP
jgi:tRNA 2-thiocytidine biosynthesis protein TtcA